MNTHFRLIGLTRLGIKPQSTPPETDALTTRPSDFTEMLDLYVPQSIPECLVTRRYKKLGEEDADLN